MDKQTLVDSIKKNKTLIFAVISLTFITPILVYIYFFHNLMLGGPEEFASFATYFSGLITPFLTLFSVTALLLALYLQGIAANDSKEQFIRQQNSNYLDKYVTQYWSHHNKYEDLIQTPIAHRNDGVVLGNAKYVDLNSTENLALSKKINSIPGVMNKKYKELSENEIDERAFYEKLRKTAGEACYSLNFSFRFASHEDLLFLNGLTDTALEMICELASLYVINDIQRSQYLELIQIPRKIHKGNLIGTVNEN